MGHAAVNQARLFAAGNDFDRLPECGTGAQQEGVAVFRLAQGLCGHGAHLGRRQALQALRKAAQAGQAALAGFVGEQAVAVEAGAQAHRFFQVIDAAVAAALHLRDFEPEAVGTDVDGGQGGVGGRRAVRHGAPL